MVWVNSHPHFTDGITKIKVFAPGHVIGKHYMALELMHYDTLLLPLLKHSVRNTNSKKHMKWAMGTNRRPWERKGEKHSTEKVFEHILYLVPKSHSPFLCIDSTRDLSASYTKKKAQHKPWGKVLAIHLGKNNPENLDWSLCLLFLGHAAYGSAWDLQGEWRRLCLSTCLHRPYKGTS